MNKIAIYLEGGGDTAQQKADLRTGIDGLLAAQKQAARNKHLQWHTVPCGGRQSAYEAFRDAITRADEVSLLILLVDSEDPIGLEQNNAELTNAKARVGHLSNRKADQWDLSKAAPEQVHLMVQCMEAWIIADPEVLASFYGQKFNAKCLPARQNLEDESKHDVYNKLAAATKNTQKGEYGKIRHASKLLALISPDKVAARCPRFKTFTEWLTDQIEAA